MKTKRRSTPSPPSIDRVQSRPGGRSSRVRTSVMTAVERLILEEGSRALSHRKVAVEAEVDVATIYRRWPTKGHLIADLFLDAAEIQVAVPDTGSLLTDLETYLRRIVGFLVDKKISRLTEAAVIASFDSDPAVAKAITAGWEVRFGRAAVMLENAIARGEIRGTLDAHVVIETLVAPVWFRMLVSKAPLDTAFISRTARNALAVARM